MIKKIIKIKNVGRYNNFVQNATAWNGFLDKTTAIYADNGTGKTTLTQIFKSLKGNFELITKRKTFGATQGIDIELLDENRNLIKFHKNKWNIKLDNIEVFDSFFIESNVYLITLGNYDKKGTFFEIVVGNEGVILAESIVNLRNERKRLGQSRKNYKQKIRKETDQNKIRIFKKRIVASFKSSNEINNEISELEKKLVKVAEDFGKEYLNRINQFLMYFNPNIQLTKLNKKGSRFVYYLKIKEYDVRSDSESVSLKHTLSEGDKSSLAFSFFLARLSLLDNIQDRLIIFDDPISSFDNTRRSVTINQLCSIAKKAKQFILLSHDINFVKDFSSKIDNCQNLKIAFNGTTSIIKTHDINFETMTGIFKDLSVLHDFLENGEFSQFDKRDVIRCIRPSLEGIFRIKFFKHFANDKWLGDMLKSIRDSDSGDIFFHLKPIYDELSDINDYSKVYHHSNPNYLEVPINTEELRNYTRRTLELIRRI